MNSQMTPDQIQRYRDSTLKQIKLNHKTRRCPSCKSFRSVGQFDEGKTKCRQCRGVK